MWQRNKLWWFETCYEYGGILLSQHNHANYVTMQYDGSQWVTECGKGCRVDFDDRVKIEQAIGQPACKLLYDYGAGIINSDHILGKLMEMISEYHHNDDNTFENTINIKQNEEN